MAAIGETLMGWNFLVIHSQINPVRSFVILYQCHSNEFHLYFLISNYICILKIWKNILNICKMNKAV